MVPNGSFAPMGWTPCFHRHWDAVWMYLYQTVCTRDNMSLSQESTRDGGAAMLRPGAPPDGTGIKRALIDAGYTQDALAATLGLSESLKDRQDVAVVARRVRADSPYNVLVRLFWLGRPVREQTLRELVPSLDLEELVSENLLRRCDGDLSATAKLGPYNDLLMASDFGPDTGVTLQTDHVLGVGAASLTLAVMTVRRKVRRALDLGCGAGVQAFLAAEHAERVVGTDVSPRALAFAEFNAWLNGISNVEWRKGSLYEPAGDEPFDLIVSNPPFVISPEAKFLFRDSGLPTDTVSQRVIENAAGHLTEGGFACILFNWHHQKDEDWEVRPSGWAADRGCDALLVCFKSADALTYAADWVGAEGPGYAQRLDEWGDYYERIGAVRISAGAMILRRRQDRPNWFAAYRLHLGQSVGLCGSQLERLFAAQDLLAGTREERELLACRLRLSDDHELRHEWKVSDGRWTLARQTLSNRQGILFSGDLDVVAAEMLTRCDGRNTLQEAIALAAGGMNLEVEKVQPACLAVVRRLLQTGFLCPGPAAGPDGKGGAEQAK
jgi:SAM-dependent methyltransferase